MFIDMSTTTSTTRVILADSKIKYGRILVPHDGSEMSDKSLNHAVYLSKISGAEIVVLGVIEHADDIPPSALLAFIRPETPLEKAKQELRNIIERGVLLHDSLGFYFMQTVGYVIRLNILYRAALRRISFTML
jgi:nucleotide-binding universal stress UspA family protein